MFLFHNPSPCLAYVTDSYVTYLIVAPQPLSPAEMQAVMMASEKEMLHKHQQDEFAEMSHRQQYQAMMGGRAGQFSLY